MERHEEAEEKIRIARKKLSELRGTYGVRMSIEEWYELVSVVESVQEREGIKRRWSNNKKEVKSEMSDKRRLFKCEGCGSLWNAPDVVRMDRDWVGPPTVKKWQVVLPDM